MKNNRTVISITFGLLSKKYIYRDISICIKIDYDKL